MDAYPCCPRPSSRRTLEKLQVGGEVESQAAIPRDWRDEVGRGLEESFKVRVNEIFEGKPPDLYDALGVSGAIPWVGAAA